MKRLTSRTKQNNYKYCVITEILAETFVMGVLSTPIIDKLSSTPVLSVFDIEGMLRYTSFEGVINNLYKVLSINNERYENYL